MDNPLAASRLQNPFVHNRIGSVALGRSILHWITLEFPVRLHGNMRRVAPSRRNGRFQPSRIEETSNNCQVHSGNFMDLMYSKIARLI
jgi:hypothetical protein